MHHAPCVSGASQLASDFHHLIVGVSNGNNIIGVQESFHAMGPRTITLPTPIATPAIAAVAGNYKRLQATYTIPSEYNSGTSFSYFDGTGAHVVSMTATTGYLGSASAVLTMPAFSGLGGFLDSWEPATGTTVSWGVQASGTNMSGLACQEGYRLMSDNVTGTN